MVQKLRAEIASCRQTQKQAKQQMGCEIYEHLLNNNQQMITEVFNKFHQLIVDQENKIAEKKRAKQALKTKLGDTSKEEDVGSAPPPVAQQMPPQQQQYAPPPQQHQQQYAPPPQ